MHARLAPLLTLLWMPSYIAAVSMLGNSKREDQGFIIVFVIRVSIITSFIADDSFLM